jgi:hypothetical protein
VTTAYGPDEPLPDLTGLRTIAAEALERVVAESSELLELWEGDQAWLSVVHRLRAALLPEPVGERLAYE